MPASQLPVRVLTATQSAAERALLRLGIARSTPAKQDRVLLVATSDGNIGDQALLESFLRGCPLPVDVIVDEPGFQVPEDLAARVTVHAFPSYTYGRNVAHLTELVAIGRLAGRSRAVVVIGADIMDGAYARSLSSVRWSLLAASAAAGRHAAVTSMSWNGRPAPGIASLARRAAARGAVVAARDPDSHARLVEAGVRGAVLTADVVFTLDLDTPPPADVLAAYEAWRDEARPLVLVNASALVGTPGWLREEYRRVARGLAGLGAQVMLVPHVQRPGNDDAAAQDAVLPADLFPDLLRVDRLLAPTQVGWLARRASVVVTGRMHLSILAMTRGVPAVVLSTQGKVSGLLRSVGLAENCVDPAPGMGDVILARAEAVLADAEPFRAALDEHLPVLIGRAREAISVASGVPAG